MKRVRKRKCRHCHQFFVPDPRNRRHQHFCSAPECRKASKAESQRRWRGKSKNRNYFRGEWNAQRVRAWRKAHSGYWRRGPKEGFALQEDCHRELLDSVEETETLKEFALQDDWLRQPAVLIGLIANLTGSGLQEEIAQTGRRLQQLGQDVLNGQAAKGGCDDQTPVGSLAGAPGPPPVQLGRSASGP